MQLSFIYVVNISASQFSPIKGPTVATSCSISSSRVTEVGKLEVVAVYLRLHLQICTSVFSTPDFRLMMSVLPLLTADRCCLVLAVKTNARFQSP